LSRVGWRARFMGIQSMFVIKKAYLNNHGGSCI
jgi:hypothetical protein